MEYMEALERQQELAAAIKHMQAEERALREGLFNGTFPAPREGTNEYTLPDGRIVKGTFKLNRSLNEDELKGVLKQLGWKKADAPVRTKTELDLTRYRELPDETRAIFDTALEIKPGLPTLEVVTPTPA